MNERGIITKPVSIFDIRDVLGDPSRDLKSLCRSSSINIQSFHKPMASDLDIELTDQQRRASDWGWLNLSGSSGGTLRDVILNKKAGQKWLWNKPSGGIGESAFRQLDFDKYNHFAPAPFNITLNATAITSKQNLSFFMENIDEVRKLNEWYSLENDDIDKLGMGVYISSSSGNVPRSFKVCLLAGKNQLDTISTLDEDRLVISAEFMKAVGADLPGTYYLVPFFLKDTSDIPLLGLDKALDCTDSYPSGAVMLFQPQLSFKVEPEGGGDVTVDDLIIDLTDVIYTYGGRGYLLDSTTYQIDFDKDRISKAIVIIKVSAGLLGSDEFVYGQERSITSPPQIISDDFGGADIELEAGIISAVIQVIGKNGSIATGEKTLGRIENF